MTTNHPEIPVTHDSQNTTYQRALSLLGSGISPEQVAAAIGVTSSRISQLLSDPEFTAKVAELRFASLQKHNQRDSQYDLLEDSLISKLSDLLPLMMRPMEVLKAIQIINAAKRRGQSAPEQIINQQTVVNISLPTKVVHKFVTNINNQVIQAGDQQLLTIQSGTLMKELGAPQLPEVQNEHNSAKISPIPEVPNPERLRELARAYTLSAAPKQTESRPNPVVCFVPA